MSPKRTCVGCRATADQAQLLRLVVAGGAVVVDERQVLPGRGAYVHRDVGCITTAVRRRAVLRALRDPTADTTHLSGLITAYAKEGESA